MNYSGIKSNKYIATDSIVNGTHTVKTSNYIVSNTTYNIDCWTYYPQDYSKRKKVSLVIFLAGQGEMTGGVNNVLIHGIPKRINEGSHFPFMAISPYHGNLYAGGVNPRWQPLQILGVIQHAITNYKIDIDRIYLTGLSFGANGVWKCLVDSEVKNLIAGAWIHCGHTSEIKDVTYDRDLTLEANQVPDIPIIVIQNNNDPVVLYSNSPNMVTAINTAQPTRKHAPKLIGLVSSVHDCWTASYLNQTFLTFVQTYSKQNIDRANTPIDINSLNYSLRLRSKNLIKNTGDVVEGWTSEKGGYVISTTTTANRPTYIENALNGFGGIDFDGVNDSIIQSSMYDPDGLQGMAIYVLSKFNNDFSSSSNAAWTVGWQESASNGTTFLSVFRNRITARFGTAQANNISTYSRPYTSGYTVCASLKTGSTEYISIDGTIVNTATGRNTTLTNNSTSFRLGGTLTADRYCGTIIEILVFNYYPNTEQQALIQQYFEQEYDYLNQA